MAIEVIERGELPEDRPYEATCNRCRSKLRFLRGDAQFTADQRDGDFLTVKCPVCGESVHTSANKPTRPVR
jgi:RNase P subunit RPR2